MPPLREHETLHAECERLAALLATDPSVRSIEVGLTMTDGIPALRIHRTEPSTPSHDVSRASPPSVGAIHAGHNTQPLAARRQRLRPIVPGTSIARIGNSATGTLGALVRRPSDAEHIVYGLSCAHVLREVSRTSTSCVTQPASTRRADQIGAIVATVNDARGDAAIVRLDDSHAVTRSAQFDTSATLTNVTLVTLATRVWKSGVATGVTTGVVHGIGFYRLAEGAPLMRGFRIRALHGAPQPISGPEDSGAVWYLDDQRTGVGLHTGFDVIDGTRCAIASHLPLVLQALAVVLL